MVVVAAAVVVAIWELHRGFAARGIDLPEQPLMAGGVVMVVVAYFWGAPGAGHRDRGHRPGRRCCGCCAAAYAGYVQNATASVFTLVYVPFLGSFVALMLREGGATGFDRYDDGVKGILTFIAVTIASDIGGYVAGVLFGRHPMAPVISPKKSWEGFAGSAVACVGGRRRDGRLAARRRLVGRGLPRPDRRGDGHPRRPVRVGDQARPRHQGHEPGDPRATAA